MDLTIRPFRTGDEPGAYEVCRRTGDLGGDATDRYDDPDLLGHIWVGPYLALAPEFAFMLVNENDEVLGYTVGVPDTAAFARDCERSWWPALRARYPETAPRRATDAELVQLMHHPMIMTGDFLATYPAHLHIDLLPPGQGQGKGRELLQTLFAALAAAGAPGVHLGVDEANVRAIGFYEHLGFHTLCAGRLMARSLP